MKVLAGINKASEVLPLIKAGAEEFFCGVLSKEWKGKYSNIASINRREWKSANIETYEELYELVDIAHSNGAKVYFAMNALYSEVQYPILIAEFEKAVKAGLDAVIVADVGFMLTLKEKGYDFPLHISTGGATFNVETVRFFKTLGAARIIFPRHLKISEIKEIMDQEGGIEYEAFIMNAGCKNIDGFCTFQHGITEVKVGKIWNTAKKLNIDHLVLKLLKKMPQGVSNAIAKSSLPMGVDSACFLNYKIDLHLLDDMKLPKETIKQILDWMYSAFNILNGMDTCGICSIYDLYKTGKIHSIKIVGRNHITLKKISDTKLVAGAVKLLRENPGITRDDFRKHCMDEYKRQKGVSCGRLCYYPEED